eukprot:3041869-Rhodomonas_salina.1
MDPQQARGRAKRPGGLDGRLAQGHGGRERPQGGVQGLQCNLSSQLQWQSRRGSGTLADPGGTSSHCCCTATSRPDCASSNPNGLPLGSHGVQAVEAARLQTSCRDGAALGHPDRHSPAPTSADGEDCIRVERGALL